MERKMTKEDKLEACAMRMDGYTLQEIADKYGVSKEYVRLVTPRADRAHRKTPVESCIYPGMAKYIHESRKSYAALGHEMGVSGQNFFRWMTGKVDMPKRFIDKILAHTGMTYEEAFGREVG